MDSDLESNIISLISQLIYPDDLWTLPWESKFISVVTQIISLARSMDLDSQPKPESKLVFLTCQIISLFNSIDLDSQPELLSELISLISQKISLLSSTDTDSKQKPDLMFVMLLKETLIIEPEPELMSLMHQIFSLVISMNSKLEKHISLCPQVQVRLNEGIFHVDQEIPWGSNNKWECLPVFWERFRFTGENTIQFLCRGCNGKNHEEYDKSPLEIRHPLHPKHSLQLVLLEKKSKTRECYCCDENLLDVFYYCSACDYAMNIACVEKLPVLSIDHPKRHEHILAMFPRQASLICNVCALPNPTTITYICLPCDFVVHRSCISLPHVIRISRHPHRISFIHSFDQGDWSCGVCRTKINNDYGGYSCIEDGCLYAAHSKCATQSNVWDGKELEGEPEEYGEEGFEPFVMISDGFIQHFSHQHHHLRLDDNTGRDYDDNKQCQICITPIYFGNFYSCMQCDFILHEACAKFFRKIYHPTHPHLLTLVEYEGDMEAMSPCSACPLLCAAGFFYKCNIEENCHFKLHVQCGTISEPLVHESHMHPLYLTSKPGEQRTCCVCKDQPYGFTETFNCIECDFSLCFECATLPQKVRYKHDKHTLTLSYGEETSTMAYWCELCEGKLNQKKRFYKCDEYCSVTLHIECLVGHDLYMKPNSSWLCYGRKICVLPNNHHMSRPICYSCNKRCPQKIVFQFCGFVFCSCSCLYDGIFSGKNINAIA